MVPKRSRIRSGDAEGKERKEKASYLAKLPAHLAEVTLAVAEARSP
jgi:hypothetical protein